MYVSWLCFVVALALTSQCCSGQQNDETTPSPDWEGLICWKGSRDSTDTNNQPDSFEFCQDEKSACMTKVEISPNSYRIYKQCLERSACQNKRPANMQQCWSTMALEKGERVCHFCCYTDTCNTDQNIPIPGFVVTP